MVTRLSQLADLIEQGSLPEWLRSEILNKQEEITRTLQETGVYEFHGPSGEIIRIAADPTKQSASAA
jgi:hypothetical protein